MYDMANYDVAVIGAGIIGCGIARELSKYKLKTVLIEKEPDVADATTKANSAIIHAGYDAKPGTNKAKFNALGNPMFDTLCRELDVPFKRVGSLVLAFSEEETTTLHKLYEQGLTNRIPQLELIGREELVHMEPNISRNAVGALYARTGGVIGPWELAIALAENAADNGVEVLLDSEVTAIDKLEDGFTVHMYDSEEGEKQLKTKYIINCAGLYSDKIYGMVAEPDFKILPRRGQYNIFDKNVGSYVNMVIFQCPSKLGKGVLVSPTVHGNLLIGPDAEDIDGRAELQTTAEGLEFIRQHASRSVEKLPMGSVITSFSGIRARADRDDFIIEESKQVKGFINVAGIESPGLSSAPAIAVYVVDMLRDINNGLEVNEAFVGERRKRIKFMELSDEERNELIKKQPGYGRIICRCESVTEGEIVDAIHRKVGARTVDGVKRRVRPGTGRCQGGFCSPRVMEILARELQTDIKDIVKDRAASYIVDDYPE